MQIKVKLAGSLKKYGINQKEKFLLELSKESTVQGLIQHLQIPNLSFAFCSVNGSKESIDFKLQNGDSVVLYPPLSGG